MKARAQHTLKEVAAADKKIRDSWKPEKIEASKISFAYASIDGIGVGDLMVAAIYNGSILGTVWYRHINYLTKTIMISDSYVRPCVRRKGIRTAIHRELSKHYKRIVSPIGTKEGTAWMKSAGYVFNADQGWWEFRN